MKAVKIEENVRKIYDVHRKFLWRYWISPPLQLPFVVIINFGGLSIYMDLNA